MAVTNVQKAVVDSIAGDVFAVLVGAGMVLDATECRSNPREAVAEILRARIQELFESEFRTTTIMERM